MQDCKFCNPCPRLLLKLIKTICGYRSLTRKPGRQRRLGQPESPSPVPNVGDTASAVPPGQPPSSGWEERGGSQLLLERDQERFRLLP